MGHFGNACGNCKWRDHGARCSGDRPPRTPRRRRRNIGDESDEDDGSYDTGRRHGSTRRIGDDGRRQRLLPAAGEAGNPIVVG